MPSDGGRLSAGTAVLTGAAEGCLDLSATDIDERRIFVGVIYGLSSFILLSISSLGLLFTTMYRHGSFVPEAELTTQPHRTTNLGAFFETGAFLKSEDGP